MDSEEMEELAGSAVAVGIISKLGISKSLFWGVAIAVVVLLAIGVIGTRYEESQDARTWNKTKAGDRLYASDIYLTDTASKECQLYRLIRPANKDDINKMHIAAWKKLKLIAQLDTSNKEVVLAPADIGFVQDLMFKNRTAFIGTYISRDSTAGFLGDVTHIDYKAYAIKPNMKVYETDYVSKKPNGYVFVDDYYYVQPMSVTLTEAPVFSKK